MKSSVVLGSSSQLAGNPVDTEEHQPALQQLWVSYSSHSHFTRSSEPQQTVSARRDHIHWGAISAKMSLEIFQAQKV